MPAASVCRRLLLLSVMAFGGPAAGAALPSLAPGIDWLPGRFVAGEQPDGNSLLLAAPGGLIVLDAGRHRAHAEALRAAIAARAPARLRLVNSHWHLDHSGGLAALRDTFPQAELYASTAIESAQAGFLSDYRRQLRGLLERPAAGAPPAATLRAELALIDRLDAARPDHAVAATAEVDMLGRRLVLGLAGGVSGGDVWLFDPASRVLASGDLVTLPVPLFDTACATRWQADLATLAERPFTTLLPGHGRPLTHMEFDHWRGAFDALLACVQGDRPAAECRDGWLQAVAPLVEAEQRALGAGLLDHYLAGLRDPAEQQRRCAPAPAPAQTAAR